MKMKRIMSAAVAAIMSMSMLAGCGGTEQGRTEDGKIRLTVGNWPDESTNPKSYADKMKKKAAFEEKYPDIVIEPDYWDYDVQTFAAKAEGETLPIIYNTHFTEAKKIKEMGYSADITSCMEKYGLKDVLSEELISEISLDGKLYLIPQSVYTLGLVLNLNLFKEAGLVNEDGSPIFPETFDDVRSMAKSITEKTGKAGFLFPTTGNAGGWNFTSLAWNFGGTFMEEKDGKWTADFNEGSTAAMEWLQSLKWEDNSMPSTTLVSNDEAMKLVGTDQAAMAFAHPAQINILLNQYGMNTDSIGYAKMPSGPQRHVTLMGGEYLVIAPQATEEQIDAAFKWLEFIGQLPSQTLSDETKTSLRDKYTTLAEEKREVIGIKDLSIWTNKEVTQNYKNELIEEFRNIDEKQISSYNDKSGIEYQTEEKMNAQDLYAILDGVIQEVLTTKGADCKALMEEAQSNFQNNFLNNAN